MKITHFDQSGFLFETSKGFTLAVDIGAYTPVEKLAGIKPDAMLVSHLHKDHLSPEQIKALSPRLLYMSAECIEVLDNEAITSEVVKIRSGETYEIGQFKVSIFDVDHGPNVSIKPKENFGFLIEADGERVYFGGDIFYPSGFDPQSLEVDKAIIPVGGFYTFGPQEAADFATSFKKAGVFIPMHYQKTPETRDQFTHLARERGLAAEPL